MYYPYDYSRSARINCKALQRACQADVCGKQGDLKVERSNCVGRRHGDRPGIPLRRQIQTQLERGIDTRQLFVRDGAAPPQQA